MPHLKPAFSTLASVRAWLLFNCAALLPLSPLTLLCTRMVELLQGSEKTGETRQATNSLNALLSGGTKKAAAVRPVD